MPFTRPCFKRHIHARRGIADPAHAYDHTHSIAFHYGRERGLLLEDVDEIQLQLFSLLDGKHSFPEIVAFLHKQDPQVTSDDVHQALDELARYGLIEDAAIPPPTDFTQTYLKRYESQLRFLSILDHLGTQKYTLQSRLKQARIAVLGLGGLGSNVLLGLAAIGIGFLRGVDFDTVEIGNLNRQVLYNVDDIGEAKVLAAARHLERFNPEIEFEPLQRKINSSQDIVDLIQDVDLVAFCADLPPDIHSWMNQASLETGIPFIMGGYHGEAAEVGPFVLPYETGCLHCAHPRETDTGEIAEIRWMEQAYWLQHPNIHFVTALAANLLCSEICTYVTGATRPSTCNHLYLLDLEHFTLTSTDWGRSPYCSSCGRGELNLALKQEKA